MARLPLVLLITVLLMVFQGIKLAIVVLLPQEKLLQGPLVGLVHAESSGWNAGLIALGISANPLLQPLVGAVLLMGIGWLMMSPRLDRIMQGLLLLLFAAALSHVLEGWIRGGIIDYLILDYAFLADFAFNLEDVVIFAAAAGLLLRVGYILELAVRHSDAMRPDWGVNELLNHHRRSLNARRARTLRLP